MSEEVDLLRRISFTCEECGAADGECDCEWVEVVTIRGKDKEWTFDTLDALADRLEQADRVEKNRDMYRDAINRVEEVLDDSDHEPSCHYLNTPFDAADQSCDCVLSRIWAAIGHA